MGSVPEGDYAYSSEKENVRVAWQALGDALGISAEEAAIAAMDKAAEKIGAIVKRLIDEYHLSPELLCLAGGGGSGGVVVPYLGKKMDIQWKIVKLDLSGLTAREQMLSVLEAELDVLSAEEPVILLAVR